jgi:hypothetical protein
MLPFWRGRQYRCWQSIFGRAVTGSTFVHPRRASPVGTVGSSNCCRRGRYDGSARGTKARRPQRRSGSLRSSTLANVPDGARNKPARLRHWNRDVMARICATGARAPSLRRDNAFVPNLRFQARPAHTQADRQLDFDRPQKPCRVSAKLDAGLGHPEHLANLGR